MFLAFLAVFACAVPALAGSVTDNYETWNVNATLAGGGSLSGSFVIDTTTLLGGGPSYSGLAPYCVSNENITISGPAVTAAGGVSGFTFSPSSIPTGTYPPAFISGTPALYLSAGTLSGGTYVDGTPIYELVLAVVAPPGDRAVFAGTAPLTLVTVASDSYPTASNLEITTAEGYDPTVSFTSGTLTPVSAVPLPPAAYLLATGLMALVWARRQKLLGND